MKNKCLLLFVICCILCTRSSAQVEEKDDSSDYNNSELEKILGRSNSNNHPTGRFVFGTFKATRIVNGHSIENTGKGVLEFRIAHRFGQINEGIKNLFGLDNATTKFSFDYGITDWLMAGIGRSSFEKEYDGFLKLKILRQTNDGRMPLSLSLFSGASIRTMDVVNILGYKYGFSNRVFYANQLLLARKFSNWLSLQLMPSYIHYNLVATAQDPNDVLAMGIGGRVKLNKRFAITAEYYYNIPGYKLNGFRNPLSIGVDIETGGHVFQLFLTNSAGTTERTFIGETTGDISKGMIHLGFNISRVFTIIRPHEPKG